MIPRIAASTFRTLSRARSGSMARFGRRLPRSVAPMRRTAFRFAPMMPSLSRAMSSSSASSASATPDMMCFQCEQTRDGTGCVTVGVCGKTPETAALQDLLIDHLKAVSLYADAARQKGVAPDPEVDRFVLQGLFSTLTNVNFDSARFVEYLQQAEKMRDRAKAMYGGEIPAAEFSVGNKDMATLEAEGREKSIHLRMQAEGSTITGLREMATYGIKGTAAYAEHALHLGEGHEEIFAGLHRTMAGTADPNADVQNLLDLCMEVGQLNLKVMQTLDEAHTSKYGAPQPTQVPWYTTSLPGPAIVVTGHDLKDVEELLDQVDVANEQLVAEGKRPIQVFTHGELLPTAGYQHFQGRSALKGHYGGGWQMQRFEFATAAKGGPVAFVATSNCIMEPRKSYRDRFFTRGVVGWPGVKHLPDKADGSATDYSEVIATVLEGAEANADSQAADPDPERFATVGFGHSAVLSVADQVIDAVQKGDLTRFAFIGGCDGSEGERSYFTQLARALPDSSVILTAGCGKYRVLRHVSGNVPNTELPRVLDMGQCNDSYGAVKVALALADAFETDVNGLPLSFAVQWLEQKAVAVLLTLLSLGVRDIHLGPQLPAFADDAILEVLTTKFGVRQIGTVEGDLPHFLGESQQQQQ